MLQIDDAGWGCLVGGVVTLAPAQTGRCSPPWQSHAGQGAGVGCYRVPDPAPGAPCNLADITPEHGHAYRADLQQIYGLAPSTISRRLAGLRAFLAWAVTAGHLRENPLAHVAGLPVRVREPAWLARDEQQRLVAVVARAVGDARTLAGGGPMPALEQLARAQAAVLTLLYTGVGISELVGLALTDVRLAENTGSLCVRSNGRARPARCLALNVAVRQALIAYLALRPNDRSDRLFVSQRGALSARQVQRILQKWAQAAGIPPKRLTAQTLRHTFGYNLAQAGAPLDQVAALLGYANLNPLRSESGGISRGLKALAKELDVPILAAAQLSRGVEQRSDRKPTLADLRESGDLEQDADTVLLVDRKDLALEYQPAELIVAKNRHGPCDTVSLLWQRARTRFVALARPEDEAAIKVEAKVEVEAKAKPKPQL